MSLLIIIEYRYTRIAILKALTNTFKVKITVPSHTLEQPVKLHNIFRVLKHDSKFYANIGHTV